MQCGILGKRLLLARVYFCRADIPFICCAHARGVREYILLMAYVTDNVHFVAYLFASRTRSLPTATCEVFLVTRTLATTTKSAVSASLMSRTPFQRHPTACKNNPPAARPLIFSERERKNMDFKWEPSLVQLKGSLTSVEGREKSNATKSQCWGQITQRNKLVFHEKEKIRVIGKRSRRTTQWPGQFPECKLAAVLQPRGNTARETLRGDLAKRLHVRKNVQ